MQMKGQNTKKRLLVDLSSLKRIYSGLGQIALGYGNYFKENYNSHTSPYELTLLVPKNFMGAFGNEVKYVSSSGFFHARIFHLSPTFDVWHSIHQLSHFKPRSEHTKLILTIHDLNYLYEKKEGSKRRNHERIQHKIERADVIVCISNFTKTEVVNKLQLHGKETEVIHNRVPVLDKSSGVPPDFEIKQPFFFTLGVVKKKKNFHTLLDLMKLCPDTHLYIVGDGADDEGNEYAMAMKERIEEEGITNVSLHPPINHAEKIWMYQHCRAFLFPSLLEGFGIPVIEALQFGKPVFISEETSLKEIGSSHAYFWDNFEPQSMKNRIDSGLSKFDSNPRLAIEASEYADGFSTDRHFKEYERIYESL